MLKQSVIYMLLGITALTAQTFNVSTVENFRDALENAAVNSQDDTIILSRGIYKTTEDGRGSFVFVDTEDYTLTIKAASGLSADDVILDGDKTDTVLKINIQNARTKIYLQNLSFINGGEFGIVSSEYLNIDGCKVHHNGTLQNKVNGGGIYAQAGLILTNSEISYNTGIEGGGLHAGHSKDNFISHSKIHHNSTIYFGGGIYLSGVGSNASSSITNTHVYSNTSRYPGAGVYSNGLLTIVNSRIDKNAILGDGGYDSGAGIYCDQDLIIDKSRIDRNTIIKRNMFNVSGIYVRKNLQLTNSIIDNNGQGTSIYAGYDSVIINNTIVDNNTSDVHYNIFRAKGTIINNIFSNNRGKIYIAGDTDLYSNYFDPLELTIKSGSTVIKKHNQEPSDGIIGFCDDHQLKSQSSVVIDKGLHPNSNEFQYLIDPGNYISLLAYLKYDYEGSIRVFGSSIDMGAYEYAPPQALAGSDKRVQVNKPITIEGKGTGSIVSYKWENEDGTILSTEVSFVYVPNTIGIDTLTLTVENCEGVTSTDTMKVTVSEFPPFDVPPILYLLF